MNCVRQSAHGIGERFRGRCGQCDACIAVQSDIGRHGDAEAGEQYVMHAVLGGLQCSWGQGGV